MYQALSPVSSTCKVSASRVMRPPAVTIFSISALAVATSGHLALRNGPAPKDVESSVALSALASPLLKAASDLSIVALAAAAAASPLAAGFSASAGPATRITAAMIRFRIRASSVRCGRDHNAKCARTLRMPETPPPPFAAQRLPVAIEDEMKSSFMDYAMSVIISRALPDVRDGLKPVHRRILFTQHQLNNTWTRPYLKSARVIGDCMGKFHPHGDAAIYDALVRMAQDFSLRYPLADGQGNWGSIDNDPAAAMRYTECRM